MTDEPTTKPHGIGWYAAWNVLALVVGYPLSVGPVYCGLVLTGSPDWLETPASVFYWPLTLPADDSDFGKALLAYLKWWALLGGADPASFVR